MDNYKRPVFETILKRVLEKRRFNGTTETALNLNEIFEAYVIGNRGREFLL